MAQLFDQYGNDDNTSIVGWEPTGIFNLNNVRYSWTKQLYQTMVGNFWLPEKVSGLNQDKIQFNELRPEERNAYKGILSFLIFLDSIQTNNIPNIASYISSPEIKLVLSIHSYQEAIHSQSYATILESVVDSEERNEIYNFWRNDSVLLSRNEYICGIYEDFMNDKSEKNFFRAVVANFLLEGIYFYNGFAFFDTLVDSGRMQATGRMIAYIRRDELTHLAVFSNIIRAIRMDTKGIYDAQVIYDMMGEAVKQEIAWSNHILTDRIPGINQQTTIDYTHYIANKRLAMLGLEPMYKDADRNPYKHLDRLQDPNGDKGNFFETTVINYTQSSSMKGSWDF